MRHLRALTILLLMLALPLHGYAAASMLACITQGDAVAADAMTPMSTDPGDQSDHGQSYGADMSGSSASSAELADADHGCGLCELCSACHCVAIFHTQSLAPPSALPQADLTEPVAVFPAAIFPRLERPPRA
jgi:hypothetical protein